MQSVHVSILFSQSALCLTVYIECIVTIPSELSIQIQMSVHLNVLNAVFLGQAYNR